MSFPDIKFGKCPRCGRVGRDQDDDTALTGYELKLYRGEWFCQLCINELEDKVSDELVLDRMVEDAKFREQAGFTR